MEPFGTGAQRLANHIKVTLSPGKQLKSVLNVLVQYQAGICFPHLIETLFDLIFATMLSNIVKAAAFAYKSRLTNRGHQEFPVDQFVFFGREGQSCLWPEQ